MSSLNVVEEVLSRDKFALVSQEAIDAAMKIIDRIDFSKINDKLETYYNWDKKKVLIINDLYKKFLALHVSYPNVTIAPSEILDEYWHMHILDTIAYHKDCETIFGRYLHHYPYFGLEGDSDKLDDAFGVTKRLFAIHFNTNLVGDKHPCKPKKCR